MGLLSERLKPEEPTSPIELKTLHDLLFSQVKPEQQITAKHMYSTQAPQEKKKTLDLAIPVLSKNTLGYHQGRRMSSGAQYRPVNGLAEPSAQTLYQVMKNSVA